MAGFDPVSAAVSVGSSLLGGGLLGGKDDGPKGGGRAEEFAINNGLFNVGIDHTKGQDFFSVGATGGLLDLQNQLLSQAGLFGPGGGPNAGIAGSSGLAFLQQLQQQGGATPQQLFGTGQLDPTITQGNLTALNPTQALVDPLSVASNQFNQGMDILQPQFDRQNLGLESRLRSQGRLGSTGILSGQADLEALGTSQGNQTNQLLFDSLNQGLFAQQQGFGQDLSAKSQLFNQLFGIDQSNLARQQGLFGQQLAGTNQQFGQNAAINELGFNQNLQAGNQLFNFGTGLSQLDPQLRAMFQGLDSNALNSVLGINSAAQGLFNSGTAAAGGGNGLPAGGSGFNPGQALGAGLFSSGVNSLSQNINNAFGPQDPFAAGNNNGFVGR